MHEVQKCAVKHVMIALHPVDAGAPVIGKQVWHQSVLSTGAQLKLQKSPPNCCHLQSCTEF